MAETLENLIPLPDSPVVKRGPVGSIEKPRGAMNSAFDTGGTGTTRKPPAPPLDLKTLMIRTDVPILPKYHGNSRSAVHAELFDLLPEGGMVEMDARHAHAFRLWCKKNGKPIVARSLGNGKAGIWRVSAKQAKELG